MKTNTYKKTRESGMMPFSIFFGIAAFRRVGDILGRDGFVLFNVGQGAFNGVGAPQAASFASVENEARKP